MSLARLASVELQLVMQHCDLRSLLALARCCHQTRAAASAPFAWRHAPPIVACTTLLAEAEPVATRSCCLQWRLPAAAPPPVSLAEQLSRSLLRHSSVGLLLRWGGGSGSDSGSQRGHDFQVDLVRRRTRLDRASAMLRALGSVPSPRLVALDLSHWQCNSVWRPSLLHSLGNLTALDATGIVLQEHDMHALVSSLPQLRTLRCRPLGSRRDCLAPLVSLPQLTDLAVWDDQLYGSDADAAPIMDECLQLRRLHCTAGLLLGTRMHRLQELHLAHLEWEGAPPDWNAVFAPLLSLRWLSLDRCWHVDAMLLSVAAGACPSLRRLRITPAVLWRSHAWSAALDSSRDCHNPGVASIGTLLRRRPEVQVELRIAFGLACVSACWLLPRLDDADWLTTTPQWTSFQPLRTPHGRSHSSHSAAVRFAGDELGGAWQLNQSE